MNDAKPPRGYVLKGKVINGTLDAPLDNGAITTDGERIAWVGAASALPPQYRDAGYTMIDLPGRSILPGLIDGHTHISFGEARSELTGRRQHDHLRALRLQLQSGREPEVVQIPIGIREKDKSHLPIFRATTRAANPPNDTTQLSSFGRGARLYRRPLCTPSRTDHAISSAALENCSFIAREH